MRGVRFHQAEQDVYADEGEDDDHGVGHRQIRADERVLDGLGDDQQQHEIEGGDLSQYAFAAEAEYQQHEDIDDQGAGDRFHGASPGLSAVARVSGIDELPEADGLFAFEADPPVQHAVFERRHRKVDRHVVFSRRAQEVEYHAVHSAGDQIGCGQDPVDADRLQIGPAQCDAQRILAVGTPFVRNCSWVGAFRRHRPWY